MLSSPMSDITDIIDAFIASHGESFEQKEGGRPWPPAGPLLCSARWTGPWGRHQQHAMMLRWHRQHHAAAAAFASVIAHASICHCPPARTFQSTPSARPLRRAVAACVREQGCVAVCPPFGPRVRTRGGPMSMACSIGQPLADASGQAGKGKEKGERSMGQTRLLHALA